MSRTSLHRPRRPRAVRDRPAPDTRLLPIPYPRLDHSLGWGIPLALSEVEGFQERNGRGHLPCSAHLNTHYKRCPKALRLCLRSDQSPSRPLHGRSPDKSRHALSKGHCQVRAPLTRRKGIATSGDAPEHGVMSLPWAIAPLPDSPGLDLARQSEQSDERRLKTNAPFSDSPGAALAGESGQSDERRLKTNAPFLDSTVVTIGELRSTNAGLGSPLLSLGMVEHFWWRRLPHRDTIARLLHILSEVRGCRRVVADVDRPQGRTPRIATGVADIMRKRPGPSTTPTGEPVRQRRIIPSLPVSTELEAEVGASAPTSASVLISPSPLKALRERGTKGERVPRWGRGAVPHPSVIPDHDRVADARRSVNPSPVRSRSPCPRSAVLKVRLWRSGRSLEGSSGGGHVCQSIALILPHPRTTKT